jgi:DNA-binding MarR family transcriptional regulator
MPKRKAKPAPRYAEQPAVAANLMMIQSRRGATVAEIAKARGSQPHTIRSVLRRLGSKGGVELTRTLVDSRGGLVYRVRLKASARSRA